MIASLKNVLIEDQYDVVDYLTKGIPPKKEEENDKNRRLQRNCWKINMLQSFSKFLSENKGELQNLRLQLIADENICRGILQNTQLNISNQQLQSPPNNAMFNCELLNHA